MRKKTDIEKRGTKKGRAGRAYDVALRRKRLRGLAKVALAAAAAGTQAALASQECG